MHFTCSKARLGRKFFDGIFASQFWTSSRKNRVFCEKLSRRFSKLNPTCPRGSFGEDWYLRTLHQFLLLRTVGKNFSDVWRKFLVGLPKLLLLRSQEICRKKDWNEKCFFYQFLILSCWFSGFRKKKLGGSTKLLCTCPEEFLGKIVGAKIIFFHHFLILGERITEFWRKTLGMVVKTSVYGCRKIFWRDKYWRKKLNQFSFELWEGNLQKFAQKFPAGPSKLPSTYHEV